MYCQICQHASDDDANYCRICGATFDEQSSTASDSPAVEWGEHVFFPKHGWAIAIALFLFGLLVMAGLR